MRIDTLEQQKQQPKVLRALATFVSYIFHPVFMPTIMALGLYWLAKASFAGVTVEKYTEWLAIIVVNTILFPLFATFLLKKLGFINSILMRDAKERIIPLIVAMACYFWAYLVFKNLDSVFILRVMLLGNFWGITLLFLVNIFLKISMHAMAIGGVLGIIIVLMLISPINMAPLLFLGIVLGGIVGTSRMILGAHTGKEIWLGYLLGILVQIAAYIYLQ
jgi:hypothetical protein